LNYLPDGILESIMLKNLFIAILLVLAKASFSQNSLDIAFSSSLFDKKEMKDSGYKEVVVSKKRFDYQKETIVNQPYYRIKFNEELQPLLEREIIFFDDSTIKTYQYNNEGKLINYDYTRFLRRKKENQSIKYKYIEGLLVEYQHFDSQKPSNVIKVSYDKKGRENRHYYQLDDSSYIATISSYNENDSLAKMVTIEKYGTAIDSVISTYKYDKNNRIIERKERYASDTYLKTFQLDCWNGYNEYYKCEYDSIGRISLETDHPQWGYYKYFYNENGYIKKYVDTENKEIIKNVFSSYIQSNYDETVLREMLNTQVKTTIFLSESSKLPKKISFPGKDIEETTTYLFEYKK